jgi:hypothetical protein
VDGVATSARFAWARDDGTQFNKVRATIDNVHLAQVFI